MNKLEKNIIENREAFDSFEPSPGHTERFRSKLGPARVSLYYRIPDAVKIAALVAIVAISSIFIYEQGQRYYMSRQGTSIQELLPGEYAEASVYYTALINEKYTRIESLSESDPEGMEILVKELNEMDRMFKSILNDLQTAPTDERILSTLINHYQKKLEVMSQIVNQLEEAKNIQSTIKSSHEKSEV